MPVRGSFLRASSCSWGRVSGAGAGAGGAWAKAAEAASRRTNGARMARMLLVRVVRAEIVDELFADEVAEIVLQPDLLGEEVVLGIDARRVLRALEVEAEPLLDALHPGPLGEIAEEREVEDDGRREDRVAAEEVDLDLHRV